MQFIKNILLKNWAIIAGFFIIFSLSYFRGLNNYELLSYDLRLKLRPPLEVSADILLIEISDDTLNNLGKWPLPRDFHASLVDVLKDSAARMIIFDVLFSEATLYDEAFSQAIKRAGNVYLPLAFYLTADKGKKAAESNTILAGLSSSLEESTFARGHINVFTDADGKVRRVPLFIKYNNNLIPQLGFKAACDWLGLDIKNPLLKRNRLILNNKLSLLISQSGSFLVNYPDKWEKSFKHLSYFEVLKAYADKKRGVQPQLDLSLVKDKVCFIGLTAVGTSDLKPVPLENIYPVLGLQASVFNSLIKREFIADAGVAVNTLINLLLFVLSLFICLRLSALKAVLGSLSLALIYFVIAVSLFISSGIWIDLFLPLFIIGFTYISTLLYRFFGEIRKRQFLEQELNIARTIQKSFLPQEIKNFNGLNISTFLKPAKFVAGDLYDILPLDDKKIAIFIGDVAGKGVPASLIMAQTISLFRIFARQYADAKGVLNQLNKELYGKFGGRFVTGIFIIIDTIQKVAEVVSAGHSPLLCYRKDSHTVEEVESSSGLPLGIVQETDYNTAKLALARGDKIILFTDGLPESRNKKGEEFGLENTKKIILENADFSSEQMLEHIKEGVFNFSYRCPQHDDITLIVLSS